MPGKRGDSDAAETANTSHVRGSCPGYRKGHGRGDEILCMGFFRKWELFSFGGNQKRNWGLEGGKETVGVRV